MTTPPLVPDDVYFSDYFNSVVGVCGLCGNSGVLDTRGHVHSPTGVQCGIRSYCICPNGQKMKELGIDIFGDNKEKRSEPIRYWRAHNPAKEEEEETARESQIQRRVDKLRLLEERLVATIAYAQAVRACIRSLVGSGVVLDG